MFGTIGFKWYSRIYKKRSQLLINEYSWLRLVTKMLEPLSPLYRKSEMTSFFFVYLTTKRVEYGSYICRMLHDKELGLHLMSDTYIVNDLIEELRGKQ